MRKDEQERKALLAEQEKVNKKMAEAFLLKEATAAQRATGEAAAAAVPAAAEERNGPVSSVKLAAQQEAIWVRNDRCCQRY